MPAPTPATPAPGVYPSGTFVPLPRPVVLDPQPVARGPQNLDEAARLLAEGHDHGLFRFHVSTLYVLSAADYDRFAASFALPEGFPVGGDAPAPRGPDTRRVCDVLACAVVCAPGTPSGDEGVPTGTERPPICIDREGFPFARYVVLPCAADADLIEGYAHVYAWPTAEAPLRHPFLFGWRAGEDSSGGVFAYREDATAHGTDATVEGYGSILTHDSGGYAWTGASEAYRRTLRPLTSWQSVPVLARRIVRDHVQGAHLAIIEATRAEEADTPDA